MSGRHPMNPQPPRCVCRKGAWSPSCPVHPPRASGHRPTYFVVDEVGPWLDSQPELRATLGRVLRLAGERAGGLLDAARGFGNEPAGEIGAHELEVAESEVTMFDSSRYAPAERQHVGDEWRYVRLADKPMQMRDVLPWLEAWGFVKRTKTRDGVEDVLHGWGTTYFAVPFDKAVER